jgi:cation diffusion facilitator family transporter
MPPLPIRRSRTALRRAEEGESVRTVVIALLANVAIAIAKLIAGLLSRSTGMLAEAAHSAADSINEVLLAVSLRRERKPPDAIHPLGHGRERFLWAFMAAIASFLIGGCLSIAMAVHELMERHAMNGIRVAAIVLVISFLADGISWIQSMRHARRQAAEYDTPLWSYLRRASDPIVRAIVFEDSVALIGVVIAATGLAVSKWTGVNTADSIASLLIGVLLAITAFGLARPLADFLVGRSMLPEHLQRLRAMFESVALIDEIVSLRGLYTGPEEVIVTAKVRPKHGADAEQLAAAMDALDRDIRAEFALVADVFIDVTLTGSTPAPPAASSSGTASSSYRASA